MKLPGRKKRTPYGVREPSVIRVPGFLSYVRKHECAVTVKFTFFCEGSTEAAHVRTGTDGGTGMKPSDCYALPLCSGHHRRQHQIGEQQFEKDWGIDMRKIADGMWAQWLKTTAGQNWKRKTGYTHHPGENSATRRSPTSTPMTT